MKNKTVVKVDEKNILNNFYLCIALFCFALHVLPFQSILSTLVKIAFGKHNSDHVTNTSHSHLPATEINNSHKPPEGAVPGRFPTRLFHSEVQLRRTADRCPNATCSPLACTLLSACSHFSEFQSSQSLEAQIQCTPLPHCPARHNQLLHVSVAPCIGPGVLSLPSCVPITGLRGSSPLIKYKPATG